MKDILQAFGAFYAMKGLSQMLTFYSMKGLSQMLTSPLSRVPADWKIIRVLLTASACVLFGMLTVYGLEFMANHWPF